MNQTYAAHPAHEIVNTLFERLNVEHIRYCHWKSTIRLPKSLLGQTDLDVLVGRSDARRFKEILYECDFKPFVSHPSRQFPAIEDYLGFDPGTGRLIHLHIHYRLVLGEQFAKNYYLPLEESYLNNTREFLDVKVPIPELEIIVLVLRALLKYRDRDVISDLLGIGATSALPRHILDEFTYLLAQTSLEKIMRVQATHVNFVAPEIIIKFLTTIQKSPRAGWKLYRLRWQVRQELAPYQRYSRLRARSIYYQVMLTRQWPFDRVARRILPLQDKHKIPVSGGLTIAFVGADGAGKSTIIKQISKWLGWRLQVRTYYMGSSRPSYTTQAVKQISKLARRIYTRTQRTFGEQSVVTKLAEEPKVLLEGLRYLADGSDRYSRYLAGRRTSAQGAITIYDRYPLDTVQIAERSMDGPRIATTYAGRMGLIARKLAEVEQRMYRRIGPVEHLFVLHVSPAVSQVRKHDHPPDLIEAKSEAVNRINEQGDNVTHINADQPLDDVLLQVKSALWRLL